MEPIKQKLGLTTDAASNLEGGLWMAMAAIYSMPEGLEKTILLGVWVLAIVVVKYLTRGHDADPAYQEHVQQIKTIDAALREARK